MAIANSRINQLILDELARRERRVLSLVVAIRKDLQPSGVVKGDLTAMVKSALRGLVAEQTVVDEDGLYSLSPAK
jgi:hypothetical protein